MLFTIALKMIKYLGINLAKKIKVLYTENYNTLLKEIEEDIDKWKDISCSWVKSLNIVKMSTFLKAFNRSNVIPVNIQMEFVIEIEKNFKFSKLYGIKMQICKAVLREKNKPRGITTAWFQTINILHSYGHQTSIVLT